MEWNTTFTDNCYPFDHGFENPTSIILTPNNGIVSAREYKYRDGSYGRLIIDKFHGNGTEMWSRDYSTGDYVHADDIITTPDGGFAVAGSSGVDFWLVRTCEQGLLEWEEERGTAEYERSQVVVYDSADECYVIAGTVGNNWETSIYIVKIAGSEAHSKAASSTTAVTVFLVAVTAVIWKKRKKNQKSAIKSHETRAMEN